MPDSDGMRQVKSHFEVIRNMSTRSRTPDKNFNTIERQLGSLRNELRKRITLHHLDVTKDREPDDEMAEAYESVSRDMWAATLERERSTLMEVESALVRLKKGEYGTCDNCGVAIPRARLEALPWARLCVHCAERGVTTYQIQAVS
jgi:DnaK suppressor protein